MARVILAAALDAYRPALQRWMPKVEFRPPGKTLPRFDAVVTRKTAGKTMRFLVEEKRHLRHQDVAIVVDRLNRLRAELPREHAKDRLLLLAPHVRPQQAAVLERAAIDYLDLAGNAHLNVPGLFVHVEGRQPRREATPAPDRPQKGWIKTVMAILVRPELVNAPYRTLADEADVALGTVAKCMNDLVLRGILRDGKARRTLLDRQTLVALWVQAYIEGLRPKLAQRRFQVRDDDKPQLWTRLGTAFAKRGHQWALTGADAAARRNQFFRADETEIYAPIRAVDERDFQKELVAQPAARDGNLIVIEPPGPFAIPTTVKQVVPVAPDLLAYAELRHRGTAQALEAAELLLPAVLGDAAD
jgi:hypothetical protein